MRGVVFLLILRRNAPMANKPSDLVQGTLDMLILKTLALEPMHGYGIAVRLEQMSKGVFRLNEPQGCPSRRAFRARKPRSYEGGRPFCRLGISSRDLVARPAIRRADAMQKPRLHDHRGRDAGAWDRGEHGDIQRDRQSSTGASALSSSRGTGRRVAHGSWAQHQGPEFIGFILLHISRAEPHVPRPWSLQERLAEHHRHGGAGAGKRARRNRWRPSDSGSQSYSRTHVHARR